MIEVIDMCTRTTYNKKIIKKKELVPSHNECLEGTKKKKSTHTFIKRNTVNKQIL